jgi:HlyD family secretion protein
MEPFQKNTGIIKIDEDGRIVHFDSTLSEMLSIEPASVIYQRFDHIFMKKRKKIRVFSIFRKKRLFFSILGILFLLCLVTFVSNNIFSNQKAADNYIEGVGNKQQVLKTSIVISMPLSSTVTLSGTIEPIHKINVVSPFNGKVIEKYFTYGQKVKKGDLLLRLDDSEVMIKLRDARSGYIRARQAVGKLKNWNKSSEVSRARRLYTKAKNEIDICKRKVDEAKILFEQGIISASEYNSAKQLLANQEIACKAAGEELDAVLEKGKRENIAIAEMALDNTMDRKNELEEQLAKAAIHAPDSGMILMVVENGKEGRKIEKGVAVTRGEIIFSLGNLDGLSVVTLVDEVDIGKLEPGQKAVVSGDAFQGISLAGELEYISSQAMQNDRRGFSVFRARVIIPSLTPEEKKHVKPGMSANLEVEVYNNPKAMLVPVSAVQIKDGKRLVMVKMSQGFKEVSVKTGITTVDSVEIISGLKPGEQVMLHNRTR